MTGDWNGRLLGCPTDCVTSIGIFRDGQWYLDPDLEGPLPVINFVAGVAGDMPVTGDWNNDNMDTIGVVNGNAWFLRNANSTGGWDGSFSFGNVGDWPRTGDWNNDGNDTPAMGRRN